MSTSLKPRQMVTYVKIVGAARHSNWQIYPPTLNSEEPDIEIMREGHVFPARKQPGRVVEEKEVRS